MPKKEEEYITIGAVTSSQLDFCYSYHVLNENDTEIHAFVFAGTRFVILKTMETSYGYSWIRTVKKESATSKEHINIFILHVYW